MKEKKHSIARRISSSPASSLEPTDTFVHRHIGPSDEDIQEMLSTTSASSLDALMDETIPSSIRRDEPLTLSGLPDRELGEYEVLDLLRTVAEKNQVFRSFIGQGYYGTITPPVVQRNILENPNWYTPYTPYQAEIAQGRLEALLNFQTMVSDLTALPVSNASLLDEATAAAEAMHMCFAASGKKKPLFFVANDCHPQTLSVVKTRADALGVSVDVGSPNTFQCTDRYCGVLLQYPTTDGRVENYKALIEATHATRALVVVATDLLALTLLTPPGEFGADIAVGSTQRLGVPMGFGGPHAAFLSTKEEFTRQIPGRIVGVSKDQYGHRAYRLAIQTREQHIRRERATSNICTSQVLLAVMASMYAIYHGPQGLTAIAERIRALTTLLTRGLKRLGFTCATTSFFDTLCVNVPVRDTATLHARAASRRMNLRSFPDGRIGISVDETTSVDDVLSLLEIFSQQPLSFTLNDLSDAKNEELPSWARRTSSFLTHPVFQRSRSEHEMLRYIKRLEDRDVGLTTSMIPLGSCTMKLNATSEMLPITWKEFAHMHPFAPTEQTKGYADLFRDLEAWLSEITGLPAVSLQPNAGSQGEFAGLVAIRRYHESRGGKNRRVCLIPASAHGTNAASAVMAGFRVAPVACDAQGNIDVEDLRKKADAHKNDLGALMVTYPSTHGVFEEGIQDICRIVHECGGQVYLDGANLNALVGLSSLAKIGADVCHINLHKTFCIPHGGGGPGMGPIATAEHLRPFLPGHPLEGTGSVSAAQNGSASILPISWVYMALMGGRGLTKATSVAILNANYMAARLKDHYPVLFSGKRGRVAHEFIIDCRKFEKTANVRVEDIAKRLMDYGFHAPTMSWPEAGTLMIEPTESESKEELDRFCDAMIFIREEIREIEQGKMDRSDNPLKNAPHPAAAITKDPWTHPYTRERAAFPAPWLREHKFWPSVGRIDNTYGDRVLVCSCPPLEEFAN